MEARLLALENTITGAINNMKKKNTIFPFEAAVKRR